MRWHVPRHVFQARAPSGNSTKYRADDLCGSLICEYFCWILGDPYFFFGKSLPFVILSIILKNKKNLYVGSFNYFSYTTQIGSNWYMDTGVHDLEVVCFKANSTWINDIGSKDLSNRPIYVVLNTHNLDMILQLKYMPIVMNPARIVSSDWKSYKCYGLWYALSSKRARWPPIFFTFLILFYHFQPAVKVLKKSVRGNFWARTSLNGRRPTATILESFPHEARFSYR